MTLEQRIDAQVKRALNVCKTRDGWQASLERSPGSFSIATGKTPAAAIAAVVTPFREIEQQASSVFD